MKINLLKSKRFIIALLTASLCSFVAGWVLVFYSPYHCDLPDIYSNEKVDELVVEHILYYNFSLSDDMKLDISVPYNLSAQEKDNLLDSLNNMGVTVIKEWRFDLINSSGYHIICKIEDICRLAEIDVIEEIRSGYIHTIAWD